MCVGLCNNILRKNYELGHLRLLQYPSPKRTKQSTKYYGAAPMQRFSLMQMITLAWTMQQKLIGS